MCECVSSAARTEVHFRSPGSYCLDSMAASNVERGAGSSGGGSRGWIRGMCHFITDKNDFRRYECARL